MPSQSEIFEKYGKTYSAGESIVREGQIGAEMFIIQSGKVKITKQLKDEEKTLVILEDGDFFGEMAVIDKGPRSASASAVDEVKCIVLNEELFEQQMQNNARIVKKILKNMSARLRDANKQIENLMIKDINMRVAHTLANLTRRLGGKETSNVTTNMTVKDLAKEVGLGSEVDKVQDVVAKLQQAKLIVLEGDKLIVASLENLEKFIAYLEMKEEFGL